MLAAEAVLAVLPVDEGIAATNAPPHVVLLQGFAEQGILERSRSFGLGIPMAVVLHSQFLAQGQFGALG